MKKLLVLLTLVVGLLGFSTGAFAQVGIDICNSCKGGTTIGTVPCADDQTACAPFNYQTRKGYGTAVYTPPTLDTAQYAGQYRAIFNICNCETAATSFVEGHRIGIRMTLLVNGVAGDNLGAYWAGTNDNAKTGNSANVMFGMYATAAQTCAADAYLSLGTGIPPMYTTGTTAVPSVLNPRFFGVGKYYNANGTTEVLADDSNTSSAGKCAVAAANKAVVLITDVTAGYTITADDVLNKLSRWWIVIPSIRIDPNILHSGELISVKIETLDQATGGICATCVATCECIIDVAKVCPTTINGTTCLFPYFTSTTSATPDNPFWNGIAIVNTSKASGTATLKVYQQDGKTGTFTTTIGANSMFVAALENIPFTGTGLGDLPLYLDVKTTFAGVSGFAMIANGETGESMGYLCK